MTHPHPSTPARERGSISIWLATTGFAMIVLVGLAVDLGGQVHAQQHARAVAAQAARTGGQQLPARAAIRGEAATADTAPRRPRRPHLPGRRRRHRHRPGHRRRHRHRDHHRRPTPPCSWASSASPP